VTESPKLNVQGPKGLPGIFLLAALFAHGCASTRVTVRDAFPLDPREGLPGPFPAGVERGWKALEARRRGSGRGGVFGRQRERGWEPGGRSA
jgi:hypothetical protein